MRRCGSPARRRPLTCTSCRPWCARCCSCAVCGSAMRIWLRPHRWPHPRYPARTPGSPQLWKGSGAGSPEASVLCWPRQGEVVTVIGGGCGGTPCLTPPLPTPQAGAPAAPPSALLQIGSCSGYTEVTVKVKQNEALPGPKVGAIGGRSHKAGLGGQDGTDGGGGGQAGNGRG